MKLLIILLTLIIMTSCNETASKKTKSQNIDKTWIIKSSKIQKHTYNNLDLLDTTFKIETYYVNGEKGLITNSMVLRKYDTKNNLISERTFQVSQKKNELEEEKLYIYDNNNLVAETDKFHNVISEIVTTKYNKSNQKIQEIKIQKLPEDIPKDWNLDSAVAHYNDKKANRYDTSFIEFAYDTNGNLINKFYKDSKNKIIQTYTTVYTGTQKSFTYRTNLKGEKITSESYLTQGVFQLTIKDYQLLKDTIWYDKNKKIKEITIDDRMNSQEMRTYKYDEKGNEVEFCSYK